MGFRTCPREFFNYSNMYVFASPQKKPNYITLFSLVSIKKYSIMIQVLNGMCTLNCIETYAELSAICHHRMTTVMLVCRWWWWFPSHYQHSTPSFHSWAAASQSLASRGLMWGRHWWYEAWFPLSFQTLAQHWTASLKNKHQITKLPQANVPNI